MGTRDVGSLSADSQDFVISTNRIQDFAVSKKLSGYEKSENIKSLAIKTSATHVVFSSNMTKQKCPTRT